MRNNKIFFRKMKRDILKVIDDENLGIGEVRDVCEELMDEYIDEFFGDDTDLIAQFGYFPDYKTYWKNFGNKKYQEFKESYLKKFRRIKKHGNRNNKNKTA